LGNIAGTFELREYTYPIPYFEKDKWTESKIAITGKDSLDIIILDFKDSKNIKYYSIAPD